MKRYEIRRTMTAGLGLAALMTGLAAQAGVVYLGTPPTSVEPGALEHDDTIYVFEEKTTTVGAGDSITVDELDPAVETTYDQSNTGTNASLPTGTTLRSYYVHFDPIGTPTAEVGAGTYAFPHEVKAFVWFDSSASDTGGLLDETDPVFGLGAVTYPTHPGTELAFRGVVEGETYDNVVLDSDGRTVSFDFRAARSTDAMRVLTTIPEPTAALLLLLGGAGLQNRRKPPRYAR